MEKSKSDLIKEMQNISEEVSKHKIEIETLLVVIETLEKKYFEIAEIINKN